LIRESLAHLLREAWGEETEVVGLPDFTDLLSALSEHGPGDVVIMDLKMPGMQGAHSVEILKARYPALPVVVLSGLFRHADVLAAMNAGAEGFVSKASGGEVLLEAVRLVLAGGTYVTNEALGDDNARILGVGTDQPRVPDNGMTGRRYPLHRLEAGEKGLVDAKTAARVPEAPPMFLSGGTGAGAVGMLPSGLRRKIDRRQVARILLVDCELGAVLDRNALLYGRVVEHRIAHDIAQGLDTRPVG
jgi:CheY-like chemotaxis protein